MSSLSKAVIHRVKTILPHTNSDYLEITHVDGFPVVIKKGTLRVGDLAVFVPCDMVVDSNMPGFQFMKNKERVKPVKLKGILSYGLLIPIHEVFDYYAGVWEDGDDVTVEINAKPYDATRYKFDGKTLVDGALSNPPKGETTYTDIESLRKYHNLLVLDEQVVITEKIHGQNFRAVYQDDKLYVGTHHQWLAEQDCPVWRVAKKYGLSDILKLYPNLMIFGEMYGWVQDIRYGHERGAVSLRIFDVLDMGCGKYLDVNDLWGFIYTFQVLAREYKIENILEYVPLLYVGPWLGLENLKHYADGNTDVPNADNIREGFVVRPTKERYDDSIGRVILKLHGDMYLQRKTNRHKNIVNKIGK